MGNATGAGHQTRVAVAYCARSFPVTLAFCLHRNFLIWQAELEAAAPLSAKAKAKAHAKAAAKGKAQASRSAGSLTNLVRPVELQCGYHARVHIKYTNF